MAKASTAKKTKKPKADSGSAATDKPAKAKNAKPAKTSKKTESPGLWGRFTAYLRGVRAEMTRVVWPTREEVLNSSLVVIVTLIFFVVFTLVVDQIVIYVLSLINRIGG